MKIKRDIQTKVSMIIPCYNKEEYIDEMLQSVFDQEYENLELILVNDGSTDGTRKKIAEWEHRLTHRGFKTVILEQKNQGVGCAVKNGLLIASGEYICIPDCDDSLNPNYVSRMASLLDENQKIDWIQCNLPLTVSMDINHDNYLLVLLYDRSQWSVWRKMVRSSYLRHCKLLEYYVDDRLSQEMSINIPLALGGSFPLLINDNLYNYKIRKNSIMEAARSRNIESYFNQYRELTIRILKSLNAFNENTELMTQIGIESIVVSETQKDDSKLKKLLLEGLKVYKGINLSCANSLNTEVMLFIFETLIFYDEIYYPERLENELKNANRIILSACMGNLGLKLLPVFRFLGFEQIICWDENGGQEKNLSGYMIDIPQYNQIGSNDILIILSTKIKVIEEISKKVNDATIYCVDEVLHYLRWKISNKGGIR